MYYNHYVASRGSISIEMLLRWALTISRFSSIWCFGLTFLRHENDASANLTV
jgi:hypothetical protein